MRRIKGLELLDEREVTGRAAQKGDRVVCNTRLFLNRGDEVSLNEGQAAQLLPDMLRVEGVVTVIEPSGSGSRRQASWGR